MGAVSRLVKVVGLWGLLATQASWTLNANAAEPKSFDAAAAFGARPSVSALTLSPNGTSVAYIVPAAGQGSVLYTLSLSKGSAPKGALVADGKPYILDTCQWVANDRLVCTVHAYAKDPTYGLMPVSRTLAANADGSNLRELSTRTNPYSRGYNLYGGDVIDWLPEEDGAVLMIRNYLPDDRIGSHLGSSAEGLGVDWVDTRALAVKHVEPPRREAVDYVTDGHGVVRVMAVESAHSGDQRSGVITNLYRRPGSREWETLNSYDVLERSGFDLQAVDRDLNVAYGFQKKDGRRALYSVALDGSKREELIYARPDVDVDEVIRVGRHRHVVGTSYALETRQASFFAPAFASLMGALARALPQQNLRITDASVDESKLLIFSSSDTDPGVYYLFDRQTHHLDTLIATRKELEGVALARMKPVTYPASDGTSIPAYLTLPPGHESAKGLPALVMPHGGPSHRDEWSFDWLAQFYASRGYAVLQPNFRGSSGYGDDWFKANGFKSWAIAIGDVLDAGRWLLHEETVDSTKLAVVGWSYGGYAALQSAVVDPTVFKAVIAIAPVTDLSALKEERRHWTDFNLTSDFIGSGPHLHEGSPLEHADRIKVPVMLFHGAMDHNVSIDESKRMAARLTAAGAKCELVTWDNLDHYLVDTSARAEMLHRSDEFLRHALGL